MKTVRDWRKVYEAELMELELTSDEEAIRKEVAEFEEKLRAEYASKKDTKITHLKTAISILNETLFREEEEERARLEKEKEQAEKEEVDLTTNEVESVEEVKQATVVEENLFNI